MIPRKQERRGKMKEGVVQDSWEEEDWTKGLPKRYKTWGPRNLLGYYRKEVP